MRSNDWTRRAALGGLAAGASTPAFAAAPRAEEVRVRARDGVVLAGTLHLPAGPGPHPAIVFVHGSENAGRGLEFQIIGAERLVAAGFAVLVTDKRGVGDTPGVYEESADLAATARDVADQVRWLRGRRGIRAGKVGLFGVSRGGWVAPLAAAEAPETAFLVLISGPAVSPNDANIYARGQDMLKEGYTAAEVEEINAFRRVLWAYYGGAKAYAEADAAYAYARTRPWASKLKLSEHPFGAEALKDPRFDYFRRGVHDPVPVLRGLKAPVLALYGDADRLIPVADSAAAMRAALSGHRGSEVHVLKGAGHGMRLQRAPETVAGTGAGLAGAPPFAPEYWPLLTKWLKARKG